MTKKEENVYGEVSQAEEIATAKVGERGDRRYPDTASAALGKFKDVNALLKAYGSLQSEFTRRSQRLKDLEKQMENFKTVQGQIAEKDPSAAESGAEKLRKNAERVKREEKKFDDFVSELERASGGTEPAAVGFEDVEKPESSELRAVEKAENTQESEIAERVAEPSAAKEVLGESGSVARLSEGDNADPSVAKGRKNADYSSEELYALASRDENVRLKIIGEYLTSLGRSGAPLTRGGAGMLAAPMRAKTIDEAGSMALRLFKRDGGV